jgi:Phosphoserine phosphatase RsbU, N-terminal domain
MTTGFSRRYRAALLDYLLGSDESGRQRAYELGRQAVDSRLGLLQILRMHQQALSSIRDATSRSEDGFDRLHASQEFLMETMSPFEMTYRGYVDLLDGTGEKSRRSRRRTGSHRKR